MTKKEYEVFFDLLDKIINEGSSTWQQRKEAALSVAGERDETNLEELAAWFAK